MTKLFQISWLVVMLFCFIISCQSSPDVEKDNKTELVDSLLITRDTVWEGDTIVSIRIHKKMGEMRIEESIERSFFYPLYERRRPSLLYRYDVDFWEKDSSIVKKIHFNLQSHNMDAFFLYYNSDVLDTIPVFDFYKSVNVIKYIKDVSYSKVSKYASINVLQNVKPPTLAYKNELEKVLDEALIVNQISQKMSDTAECWGKIVKVLDVDFQVIHQRQKKECGNIDTHKWWKAIISPDTTDNAKFYFNISQKNKQYNYPKNNH